MMFSASSFAQQKKLQYAGSLETALLNGGYESNVAINTTHGIRLKSWDISIGAGVDYYRFRSVPVFLDVRKHLSIGKLRPFIQSSIGMNTAWPTAEQKVVEMWWSWLPGDNTLSFSNGLYSKAVVGLPLNPGRQVRVNAVAGWSHKTITTSQDELVSTGPGSRWETRRTNYAMNRLYIGLGVSF